MVEADALKVDWSQLWGDDFVLVSNLPYQISSSLVIDLSLGPPNLAAMVLMFQKEVAQRMTAESGFKHYGLLSVMAQTYWKISTVAEAGPGGFYAFS